MTVGSGDWNAFREGLHPPDATVTASPSISNRPTTHLNYVLSQEAYDPFLKYYLDLREGSYP